MKTRNATREQCMDPEYIRGLPLEDQEDAWTRKADEHGRRAEAARRRMYFCAGGIAWWLFERLVDWVA